MKLPNSLSNSKEWTLVGPMGPQLPEGLLAHSILCVDGGARFCSRMDVWIGDGDSYPDKVNCPHIFPFSPEKSQSDLALALTFLEGISALTLHCWGFLGGRKDHELINFGEMLTFLEGKTQSHASFYDEKGHVALKILGPGSWDFQRSGLFSLASLKNVRVKILGQVDYPLTEETELKPLSSLGLSNRATGSFEIINQGPVMILFPEAI